MRVSSKPERIPGARRGVRVQLELSTGGSVECDHYLLDVLVTSSMTYMAEGTVVARVAEAITSIARRPSRCVTENGSPSRQHLTNSANSRL
jgi:hypothetical protein